MNKKAKGKMPKRKARKFKNELQNQADLINDKHNHDEIIEQRKKRNEYDTKRERLKLENRRLENNILFYLLNNGLNYVQAREVINNLAVEITRRMNIKGGAINDKKTKRYF